MEHAHSNYRLPYILYMAAALTLAGCDGAPTQPMPIVPPVPPVPPAPIAPRTVPLGAFIGTEVGGFESIGTIPTSTYPKAINVAGLVVGTIVFGRDEIRAFVWSRNRRVEDLGTLPGDVHSEGRAINDNGEVAGNSIGSDGTRHAFKWTVQVGMISLGSLPGFDHCFAKGINNLGDVVGECMSSPLGLSARPFLWTEGTGMRDLGTLGTHVSGGANAINDQGQIAGYSSERAYYDDSWAILWGEMASGGIQIGLCPDRDCYAEGNAVNTTGDVAGTANSRAFLQYRRGVFLDLGGVDLDNRAAVATGINDKQEVVGINYPRSPGSPIGSFIWTRAGGMRRLTALPGRSVIVTGINSKSVLVGYSN